MSAMRQLYALAALAFLAIATSAIAQTTPSPYTSGTRYDASGHITGMIAPDPDGSGPLHFAAVRNSYDGAGRLIKVENGELATWQSEANLPASWTGFTVFRSLELVYDSKNRKIRETLHEGTAGTVRAVTQFSYDSMGRLECTAIRMTPTLFGSLPASACTQATPAGVDGPDRITRNIYDAAGQRVQSRDGVGTSVEGTEATWAYSPNGRVTTVIDGNGNRAELRYDAYDRQDRWTFPSTTRPAAFNDATPATALATAGNVNANDYEGYGYDANGNRTSLRKRDGSTIAYQFDALNRMTAKIVPERLTGTQALTAAQTRDVYYSYDLRNLQLSARFDSQSGEGVTSAYDGFGQLTSSSISMGGMTRTLAYQYDADGNRTRITHPDLNYFRTDYDGLNRPTAIHTDGSATVMASLTYYDHGARQAMTRSNLTVSSWGYDGVQRLSSMTQNLAGTSGDASWTFGRNPAGELSSLTRDNNAYAWTGHYAVNRAYTTNGLNQYSQAGPASFAYDANGNLVSDGSRTFVYDIENRLVSSSNGAQLVYDPLGRLFQVTGPAVGGGTSSTRFVYDGDALAVEYVAATGVMLRRHVHWPGADVPAFTYEGTTFNFPRFQHVDHQGSVIALSQADGTGAIVNMYDEYGIPGAYNSGRFQYTGQAWLAELGMYYYKARIYSPTLGRFMQTDPIGYADQFNFYEYVGDDPVNVVDPSGRDAMVYIMANGNVQIYVPVLFSGDASNDINIQQVSSTTSSVFQGNVDGHQVTTEIVPLTEEASRHSPVVNTMEIASAPLTGGHNGGHSYVAQGHQAHLTMMDQNGQRIPGPLGTSSESTHRSYTGAHEVGHLLGLPDTHRIGDGIMDHGNGTRVTPDNLRSIMQTTPMEGVRNMIFHCPPDCPEVRTP